MNAQATPRQVVVVGLDGGSRPMYRYADELMLNDSARSIVSPDDRPDCQPDAPHECRVVTQGVGHGYYVIALPAAFHGSDVRDVPDRFKRTVAGPYTSHEAAQSRASQENWRNS